MEIYFTNCELLVALGLEAEALEIFKNVSAFLDEGLAGESGKQLYRKFGEAKNPMCSLRNPRFLILGFAVPFLGVLAFNSSVMFVRRARTADAIDWSKQAADL
eukprot:3557516-Rhodomonas_salina.8